MAYIWRNRTSSVQTVTLKELDVEDYEDPQESVDISAIPMRLISIKRKKRHSFEALDVNFFDTLSYYRAYMLSVVNHCNLYLRFQYARDNRIVVRQQFFRIFEGPLACMFIQMFLGMYVPHTHLYTSKMTPLYSGSDALYYTGATLELTRFVDGVINYLTYLVEGLAQGVPWNSCPKNADKFGIIYNNKTMPIECLLPETFVSRMDNRTQYKFINQKDFSCYHYRGSKTCLSIPQVLFSRSMSLKRQYVIPYYQVLVWMLATCCCKTIYKQRVWRSLSIVNCVLFVTHLFFSIYVRMFLKMNMIHTNIRVLKEGQLTIWETLTHAWATYVQVPPVIHIVTARRVDKTIPGRDSAILLISITLYSMSYFYVHSVLLQFASSSVGMDLGPVVNTYYVETPVFYMFTIFWQFSYGNLLSLFYLCLQTVHEFLIFLITYQLVIEFIVEEHKWIGRYLSVTVVTILGLCINMTIFSKVRVMVHAYTKTVVLVVELTSVYLFYPLRRLLDDMNFFYGTPLSKFWRIVLVAYPISFLNRFIQYSWRTKDDIYFKDMDYVFYSASILIPGVLVLGAVYMLIKLHWNKRKMSHILCPVSSWGPRNFTSRQLRKQFNSREYELSLAPKVLTRHLMRMAEPDMYHLDINYEHMKSEQRPLTVAEAFDMIDKKF